MSENINKNEEDDKNQLDRMRDRLGKKPGQGGSGGNGKKSFNFYWIYAIIGLVLISLNLFPWGNSPKETHWREFSQKMLQAGHVEKVTVVNGEVAEIFIKADTLKTNKLHTEAAKSNFGNSTPKGPHYTLRIGSIETRTRPMMA